MAADRSVGVIGLACAVGVAVILGIHPLGSTDVYDDGQAFLEHVGWFWVAIHFVATPLLFGLALVIRQWASGLTVPAARVIGQWAGMVALAGMAIGALHLVGTDTVIFLAFSDTFEAANGSEAALIGADLLLRIHAATLTSWIVDFWFLTPLLVTAALAVQGDQPRWLIAIAGLSAQCRLVSVVLFLGSRSAYGGQ